MPHYDYACDECGPFSAERRMADFALPHPCPGCGKIGARALALPSFAAMDRGRRTAIEGNERSRSAPARVSGGGHPSGCSCCRPAGRRVADSVPKTDGTRPWMIGH